MTITTAAAMHTMASGSEKLGTTFIGFTTGLVIGTMDSLVNAQIKQLESYAEMLNAVSGDVVRYQESVAGLIGSSGSFTVADNKDMIIDFSAQNLGIALTHPFSNDPVDISGSEELIAEQFSGAVIERNEDDITVERAVAETAAVPPEVITETELASFILDHFSKKSG